MPVTNLLGYRAVTHENGVHRRAKKALDEQRGVLVGTEEIGEGPQDGAFAEPVLVAKQAGGGRSEADAFALERFECVDLARQ